MIPEELIPGIEGGVDTGRAHKTGAVYDLYFHLVPFTWYDSRCLRDGKFFFKTM